MSGFLDVMSGAVRSFVNGYEKGQALRGSRAGSSQVERLCAELRWDIDEREDNRFYLDFQRPSGMAWRISITEEEGFVRLFVAHPMPLPSTKATPVLAHLLTRNAKLLLGGWVAIHRDDGKTVVAVFYRALAESLTAQSLQVICKTLLGEVEEFDEQLRS
jgi:hypothetical protein